uniref:Oxidoreductase n=1 Tax=Panagrolaimus sp. ES5 TaxID=591445 RepID=A0AC34GPP2_9BILA
MSEFKDNVVIITGSSSGIGQDAALGFAREGANVVIHGQNEKRMQETVDKLHKIDVGENRILTVAGSMEDDSLAPKLIEKTIQKFGKINILVNNAGATCKPNTDSNAMENFDYLMKVNLRSIVHLTQLAIPYLEKTKGNIVNVSSAGAVRAFPDVTFYTLTKAALDHYTRNCALMYGSKGIRINSINPGPVNTEIFSRHNPPDDVVKNHQKWVKETTPLGHSAGVSEITPIILFLASDRASFVTGASWFADGGHSIYMPPIPPLTSKHYA